jgi:cytochrome c peroxidase
MIFVVLYRALLVGVVLISGAAVPASAAGPFTGVFSPLPEAKEFSALSAKEQARVHLGKQLYLDPNLSESRQISCNSCHRLDRFGVDGEPTSPGHEGKRGDRNSPTTFNAALHFRQFWDGRAADVEEQALGPVLNPVEMAMASEDVVVSRLSESKEYRKLFKQAFPDEANPITFKNLGRAIGAFERQLVTPAPFDRYLRGDMDALSPEAKKGLQTFVTSGCIACHAGALLGGQMYQKLGLVVPYETGDPGRYNVTKREEDRYFFKVPSLRNVEKTGPYFHDGSVESLESAVRLMGKHQLGRDLSEGDISDIIAFLHSLTGELDPRALPQ